jgi:hypothetical protein
MSISTDLHATMGDVIKKPPRRANVRGHGTGEAPPMHDQPTPPRGICECGCGQQTNLAPYSSARFGWTNGQPLRFVNGHSRRRPRTWTVRPDGCWQWNGYVADDGYGRLRADTRMVLAHRWVYEERRGAIPADLELDHLCRNRSCVNPDHLEPVVTAVNVLRGESLPAQNARKTHCVRGHAFVGDNLYVSPRGWRYCRACNRIRDAKRRRGR